MSRWTGWLVASLAAFALAALLALALLGDYRTPDRPPATTTATVDPGEQACAKVAGGQTANAADVRDLQRSAHAELRQAGANLARARGPVQASEAGADLADACAAVLAPEGG